MRAVSASAYRPFEVALGLFVSVFVSFVVVAASDISKTYLILMAMAAGGAAVAFLAGDIKRVLMTGFVVAIILDITKAIVTPDGKVAIPLNFYAADVFLLPLTVLWMWEKFVVRRERYVPPVGFWPSLAYVGWAWVCVIPCEDKKDGILAAMMFTKFFLAYLVVADTVRGGKAIHAVLTWLAIGLVLTLIMVSAQFATRSQLQLQGAKATSLGVNLTFNDAGGATAFRPAGFFHHPLALAKYLDFALPILAAILFLGAKRVGSRTWHLALALAVGAAGALIVTLSRAGWICGAVAILFFMVVGYFRGLVKAWHFAVLACAAVGGALVIGVVYPNFYIRIFAGDHRSTESRIAMIDQAWLIFKNHPITGVGPGHYNRATQIYVPQSFTRIGEGMKQKLQQGVVHNEYMSILAERGVPGFVLLWLVFFTFLRAFFRVKQWSDPTYMALALALTSGAVSHVVFYAFDKCYFDISLLLLWFNYGLFAAVLRANEANLNGGFSRGVV